MIRSFERSFEYPFVRDNRRGGSIPRAGLLLYLGRPNLEAADVPIGDDTEIGDDTIIRRMFLLPADAYIRAATGWVSGTANLFYTAEGASVAVSDVEINAWNLINLFNVMYSVKGVAVYDLTSTYSTLIKAARFMNINTYTPTIIFALDSALNDYYEVMI